MKIVIAIDSFKGCASSVELANAIERGMRVVYPNGEVLTCPVADGGEGTVEALSFSDGAKMQSLTCKGPLGDEVNAIYTILKDKTAVIEMAAASGLPLIPISKRDPSITSTYGTGEIIKDAILKGCREFIIGLGGSATNDAGLGMLRALGFKFLDQQNEEVKYAKNLSEIVKIERSNVIKELYECNFSIACDVTNPLYGENGASVIYGPQKGADAEKVNFLDAQHSAFAKFVAKENGIDFSTYPGAGAAGGLGFGFVSFLNAHLKSGIKIILDKVGLHKMICDADFVITGEGKVDEQSVMGKVIDGISTVCKKQNTPCLVIAGHCDDATANIHEKGVTSVFSILSKPMSLEEAMDKKTALRLMEKKSEQIFRLISSIR